MGVQYSLIKMFGYMCGVVGYLFGCCVWIMSLGLGAYVNICACIYTLRDFALLVLDQGKK